MKKSPNHNLPKGWRKVKLGEIVEFVKGKKPKQLFYKKPSEDFLEYVLLGDQKIYVKPKYSLVRVLPTDIIIVADGASSGKIFTGKNGILGSTFLRIRIRPEYEKEIDSRYLYFCLKYSENIFKSLLTGSAIPHVDQENLRIFEVLIPEDINEQKRIADILSAFDDKIELNNKIIKTLEEMAQEIFKEWFNENSKLKAQNSKLGGWEIKDAEEMFVFEKGIEPGSKYYSETKKEGYIPFYRVRDLDKQSGVDVYIPKEIANGKICKENDILLSLDATVGRVKIGCNGAFSSGIRKVYSRDGFIKNSFIYFWLKTPYVQNTILEHASGTTILHAGQSIKYLRLPFNKEVIKKIQSKVDPMFEKILQILKENQKLAELRDLLLPKLMSGEIRV
jgi:type I restriction enzyme S subunit